MRRPSANWNVVRAELPKSFEPAMSGMGSFPDLRTHYCDVRFTPMRRRR
jgi:hypothetical protein